MNLPIELIERIAAFAKDCEVPYESAVQHLINRGLIEWEESRKRYGATQQFLDSDSGGDPR